MVTAAGRGITSITNTQPVMRRLLFAVAPVLAVAAFASNNLPEGPEIGAPAPEFTSGAWFNNIGQTPSIASLKGKAILIEFWATW
jgi:hypothetical protein